MRNITFSAEDQLIAQGRALAQERGRTLNDEFRLWLKTYVDAQGTDLKKAQMLSLIDELTAQKPGKPQVPMSYLYTPLDRKPPVREGLNEREQRILARTDAAH